MAERTTLKIGDVSHSGDDLDFEPLKETWNEYRCEDGAFIKLKTVVSKIVRLDAPGPQGEPVYQIMSTSVVAVRVRSA